MRAAEGLVAQLTARLGRGDAADDLRAQLTERVAEIHRHATVSGGKLPDAVQSGIARLLSSIQVATASGEAWLTRPKGAATGSQSGDSRIRRAYGLPPRET